MNIATACEILSNLRDRTGIQLLELVTDYRNGQDQFGFNGDYGIIENMAFKTFIRDAQQFFAPVEV